MGLAVRAEDILIADLPAAAEGAGIRGPAAGSQEAEDSH